jgi:hypothetical protein
VARPAFARHRRRQGKDCPRRYRPTRRGSVSLIQGFRPADPAYASRASEARRGAISVALEAKKLLETAL